MKIFSAEQTRAWDAFTIQHEPIASIQLMNRAAETFARWFAQHFPDIEKPVYLCCGTGNNGGDGVAVARLLHWMGYQTQLLIFDLTAKRSPDFEAQIENLPRHDNVQIKRLKSASEFPVLPLEALVVDALFGSGLNRPLEGDWAKVVEWLNTLSNEKIAIDLPSGLLPDAHTAGWAVVQASHTFSFERPKLAFFFPENASRVGVWSFGSIGLHPDFDAATDTPFRLVDENELNTLYRPRPRFAHKGNFGHALLIAGSFGKMGAAVLAAKACLRAGAGLLSVHVPRCGNIILQTTVPEAMVSADQRAKRWTMNPELSPYASIGVGPGVGRDPQTALALEALLRALAGQQDARLVLDADALNLLAENPSFWSFLPKNAILTPHPKEFERLFGETRNDFERNKLQREMAQKHGVFILLKGAYSAVACPDGACWFNTTGNPGMATGGSGDVLTGILTGLLAQGYAPKEATLLGVYLHGLAGDLAANDLGEEALLAGDLVDYLGKAWKRFNRPKNASHPPRQDSRTSLVFGFPRKATQQNP